MGDLICAACRGAGMLEGIPCAACGGPPLTAPGVFGKYALDREVGRGSMGIVFEARDTTLDRRVALKVLFVSRSEDPREGLRRWQRFMQEARLTAGVAKHAGVVTLYEAGVHEGRRFLAMEYVAGEPLGRWRAGRSVRDQVRVLRDAALAVHHAHEHGIIHRDLKPANVLVLAGGHPVVTDFGLATTERLAAQGGLTPSDVVVGSPAYMSPEQARGDKDAGRASDVYGLGIMLYETVAGRLPFEGRSAVETLSKVMSGTKVPPSRATAGGLADAELDAVCLRAMALEPERRHPTALAFAEDLSLWLGERAPTRKPRVLLAAAMGALIGGAAVALLYALVAPRAPAPAAAAIPLSIPIAQFTSTPKSPYNRATSRLIDFRASGLFEASLNIPEAGLYRVVVSAEGDTARGELPRLKVSVDGLAIGDVALSREAADDYEVRGLLGAGDRRIGLRFENDFYDAATGEDRNVRIFGVTLYRVP